MIREALLKVMCVSVRLAVLWQRYAVEGTLSEADAEQQATLIDGEFTRYSRFLRQLLATVLRRAVHPHCTS